MKADTEALKKQMATMMGAMMSIKEIMEVSVAYRTRARARVMSEVEEVQEQMKADMEAMKEQMATMMEVMMSMKNIMEAKVVVVAATGVVVKVNQMPPSGLNQMNHPTSNMVGKDLGSTGGPPLCTNSKQACLHAIWLASQLYTTQCGIHSQ